MQTTTTVVLLITSKRIYVQILIFYPVGYGYRVCVPYVVESSQDISISVDVDQNDLNYPQEEAAPQITLFRPRNFPKGFDGSFHTRIYFQAFVLSDKLEMNQRHTIPTLEYLKCEN